MFYRQRVYKLIKTKNVKVKESQEILNVDIYPIDANQKKMSRKRKKKESLIKQKNLNDKNAKLNFYRKVQCNFDESDYVWHITYSSKYRPNSIDDVHKDFKSLLGKINAYRKKLGLKNARYMGVIEGGEGTKKRIHLHIIIDSDIHRDILEGFWKKGNSNIDRLQPNEEGLKDLTSYMTKDPKGKKRWKQSKGNLVEPVPSINDNRFSRKKMKEMLTNNPSKEEIEKLYPGYILTNYKVNYNEENAGVYINISMRRMVKNKLKE